QLGHLTVIQYQLEGPVQRNPHGLVGSDVELQVILVNPYQTPVGDGNNPAPRVSIYTSKAIELLHIDILKARQFKKNLLGGFTYGFVYFYKSSQQGQTTGKGFNFPLENQQLQLRLVNAKDNAIDRRQHRLNILILRRKILRHEGYILGMRPIKQLVNPN